MDFSPITESGLIVQVHLAWALLAFVVGGLQFYLPKGTRFHKAAGWFWVVSMAVVAISSFFIHEIRLLGPFSPIHLLSILVLYSLVQAIRAIRAGKVAKHKKEMKALYFYALMIAGLFTFAPGRVMYRVFFGG